MKSVSELINFAAFPLDKVKGKIANIADQLAIHTLLYYLYPNNESVNHWISEIVNSFLDEVKDNLRYKGNRKLNQACVSGLLFSYEFEESSDLPKLLKKLHNKHNLPKVEYNHEDLMLDLDSIYTNYVKYIYGDLTKSKLEKYLQDRNFID